MKRANDLAVFIDPVTPHFLRNELFNPASRYNLDNKHEPYFHLRRVFQSRGIELHTADFLIRNEVVKKTNLYFSLGILENYKRLAKRHDTILSGFFTFDAPIVMPWVFAQLGEIGRYFKRVYSYTTSEELVHFGCGDISLSKFHIPQTYDCVFEELWGKSDRRFLAMVNTNKLPQCHWQELYTERLRALEYFGQRGEIDLYGIGWDRMPYRVGKTWVPVPLVRVQRYIWEHLPFRQFHPYTRLIRRIYKGPVKSKFEVLSSYTFTLSYENMILGGWVNEKMFDCFLAGTIPIYLGAPDITDYVPADCFIDKRQFPTYEDLRQFLKSLSQREIRAYKENARDYLASEMYKPFRKESFADTFIRAVEQDAGVSIDGEVVVPTGR
jgi:hypothetical protein